MNPGTLDRPMQVLRVCLHALVGALLLVTIARASSADDMTFVVISAVVLGVTYAAGPLLRSVERSYRAATGWLTIVEIVWLVLLSATPEGVWLAFPLFFVQMHLLPPRWGVGAVAVTTVAAVAGFAWHQGSFEAGMILGPVLGAAVAVATALGYQTLNRQSQERLALIEQLRAAHDDLAVAEHSAGVLAERERLSREIHDTLAQGFSSIQLLLRAAERVIGDRPEAAGDYITKARQTAHDNLTEARRLVYALAPAELEGASLTDALQRLCSTTQDRSGLSVTFHRSGEPHDVATPIEVAALRIAQSALANTVQHAQATRADVTLSYVQAGVTVDVVDDGIGFDPDAAIDTAGTKSGGFGLSAMRRRARSLGGSLNIESSDGEGTALAAGFPDEPPVHMSVGAQAAGT